jgi:hypothetical protein
MYMCVYNIYIILFGTNGTIYTNQLEQK